MTNTEKTPGARLRLHHVAVRAADVEVTLAFYERILGLAVVRDQRPRSVWLRLDEGAVLMIEARGAREPGIPANSMELIAFLVSPEQKAQVRSRVRSEGCFDGETEHTVYLRDPDGRRLGVSTFPLT